MSNTDKKYEHALLLLWLDFMNIKFHATFVNLPYLYLVNYELKGP